MPFGTVLLKWYLSVKWRRIIVATNWGNLIWNFHGHPIEKYHSFNGQMSVPFKCVINLWRITQTLLGYNGSGCVFILVGKRTQWNTPTSIPKKKITLQSTFSDADKHVINTHTHTHTHIHSHTRIHRHMGNDNTWRPKVVKMLYSCMYASFVSCYCILVEKIDDKCIFLTPSLTFPVFESDHFGNSNMWPVGMLRAIVGSPLTHWGRTTHICVNKISS